MSKLMAIFFILIGLTACQSNNAPEQVLIDYVDYRFQKNHERDEVLKYITGSVQSYISEMSADEFNSFAKEMKDFKKISFKIMLKKCSEKRCFITYKLNYKYMGYELEEKADENKDGKVVAQVRSLTNGDGESRVVPVVRSQERIESEVEVRKIAELENIDGEWKISKVSNIKTSIQGNTEIKE